MGTKYQILLATTAAPITLINLGKKKLTEGTQMQKTAYIMIPFI